MIRSRFLFSPVRMAAHALALSLPVLALSAWPLWAQTSPVFETPPAGASTSGTALLEEAFDFEPEPANAPKPSLQTPPASFSLAQDASASGARALRWKYALGREEPSLSWSKAALLDLSSARSVGLKVRSNEPTAVEIWFETDVLGEGADSVAARYSTTIWSAGASWQQVSVDRARFSGHEIKGGVLQKDPIPSALWDAGWRHIARWGVSDATNVWRLFAGQARDSGARTLWLDDLKVSTAPSPNAATPPPAPPQPAPQQAPDNGEDQQEAPGEAMTRDDFGDNRARQFPQSWPQNQGWRGGRAGGQERAGQAGKFLLAAAQEGDEEQGGGQGGEAAAPAQVQAVVQDAWGALENWIPINGTTVALEGEHAGLKWSMVRLANRDAMLISTVNPELLRAFPPESVRRRARGADVVIQSSGDRLLRLAIAAVSSKPTVLQVALYESDGGVWTALVPLDMRRKYFVPVVALADFVNAPTRRDSNGQLDLNRIIAVSLQDLGAQKNMAGPNEITLRGMTWIY